MDRLRQLLIAKIESGEATITGLARAGGVSRQHIYNILYGRAKGEPTSQPTLPLAERLAAAIGAKLEISPGKKPKKLPA